MNSKSVEVQCLHFHLINLLATDWPNLHLLEFQFPIQAEHHKKLLGSMVLLYLPANILIIWNPRCSLNFRDEVDAGKYKFQILVNSIPYLSSTGDARGIV